MTSRADRFLICGLGSLGQQCVRALHVFAKDGAEVLVTALDASLPATWEVPELPSLLAEPPVEGDCRSPGVLSRAGVERCRAVLLVTTDESVNVAAAFAVRRLAPSARIVVRSSRDGFNDLLAQRIPNLVALEPAELPAAAFALAGRDDGTLGLFRTFGRRLRVVEKTVGAPGGPPVGSETARLSRGGSRLVALFPAGVEEPGRHTFFSWPRGTILRAGDRAVFVEEADGPPRPAASGARSVLPAVPAAGPRPSLSGLLRRAVRWVRAEQKRMIVGSGILLAILLWLAGTLLLRFTVPSMTWQKAIASGVILMLGGFGDVFGGLQKDPVPWWVLVVCLGITLTSLLFILGVFGLIAEGILSSRLDLLARRVRLPKGDHVVLLGLGRVGRRVAAFLVREMGEKVIAVTSDPAHADATPDVPVLVGSELALLGKANLPRASRLVAVTDDAMLNLEAALEASRGAEGRAEPLPLVIRVFDEELGESVRSLLPEVRALNAYALAAQALAGTAFGESVLAVFPLGSRTVLVASFRVAAGDTLAGRLLFDVACGYGVAPCLHRRAGAQEATPLPADELRLEPGDDLVVLATLDGLRRIERADAAPKPRHLLSATPAVSAPSAHEAVRVLCAAGGLPLETARTFVDRLPGSLALDLFELQAERLSRQLATFLPHSLDPEG